MNVDERFDDDHNDGWRLLEGGLMSAPSFTHVVFWTFISQCNLRLYTPWSAFLIAISLTRLSGGHFSVPR
jgi:hypothetical protein